MIVAIRDKQLASIQNQIENRRKLLLANKKKLQVITDENEYLKEIAYDYDTYFNYIKEQKEQQVKAFDLIYKYLGRIIKSNKYTEEELINAIREQKEILNKINDIRSDLNNIMNDK